MRLHQPVGIWLLLWPCGWSVALESGGRPPLTLLAAFAAGAVAMRSAGCIINDLWDRDLDAQVERTRVRPLASGEVSVGQALGLLAALLCIGLMVAVYMGPRVVLWAAASLPLVAAYPLMKRVTWWPQAFLGLTFNWGALLGAVAVRGAPDASAWLLYAAGFFWTLGYDTIYAHQDIRDDAAAGIKSSARKLGGATKPFVAGCYAACMALLALAGAPLFALVPVGAHFAWQMRAVQLGEPDSCGRVFRSNAWAGGLVFLACLI